MYKIFCNIAIKVYKCAIYKNFIKTKKDLKVGGVK